MEHLSKLVHCLLVQLLLIAQTESLNRPTTQRYSINVSSAILLGPVQPNLAKKKKQGFFQILVGYIALVVFRVKTVRVFRCFTMAHFVQ